MQGRPHYSGNISTIRGDENIQKERFTPHIAGDGEENDNLSKERSTQQQTIPDIEPEDTDNIIYIFQSIIKYKNNVEFFKNSSFYTQ